VAASAAVTTLTLGACGREPSSPTGAVDVHAHNAAVPDTAHITLYNRGTTLLQHDSLRAALPLLKSAQESPDSTLQFRASFNSGWDYLVTGTRTLKTIQRGGPAADSLISTVNHIDTASSIGTAPGVSAPAQTDQRRMIAEYISQQLASAVIQYRTALMQHPNDRDAKWNYELAYRASQAAGNKQNKNNKKNDKKKDNKKQQNKKKQQAKKKDKGNQKPKKKDKDGKTEGKTGKTDKQPPVERMRLPSEQAEQLLNALGQHEQKAVKPVPAAPPVHGKDW
jgi:hypothetical protein